MRILSFVLIIILSSSCVVKEDADFVITNATVIDGTGSSGRKADVVVIGDSIVFVGTRHNFQGNIVIDAQGKVLTPGFIDPHAHGNPINTPGFENFISQGITTICLGQDGSSPPLATGLDAWFNQVDSLKPGVNVSMLLGHGTLRRVAKVPDNEDPDLEQLELMVSHLEKGINDGAWGMSTGLEYIPGYYADEPELIALAKKIGEYDGILMSHNRNEDDYAVNESVRELIRQGQHCRVQVSHLKVVFGKGQSRALELLNIIDSAREAGIQFYADVYPYMASHTGIGIVFPDWAKGLNDFEKVKRERREELKNFITDKVNYRNGPQATLFGTDPWAGKTLKEVSDSLEMHFSDLLIDIIGPEGASAAYFVMDNELQEKLIGHEDIMVCTDGSPTMRHPRGYGSFAKVIKDYTIGKKLFDLPTAIHKMSGLPAKSIGISDRGFVKAGYKADLLLFNPEEINDPADFENPYVLSEGFNWVMINGKVVKEGNTIAESRQGKLLRKPIL